MAAAAAVISTVLLTGLLVLARLLPWTPVDHSVGGPYSTATATDVGLAAQVASATPANAIFLTEGKPNDPVLTLAGRTAVLGYYGWLWSYGTDFGSRPQDVRTMLEGCHNQPRAGCAVFPLLPTYRVDYVVDNKDAAPSTVLRTQPVRLLGEKQARSVLASRKRTDSSCSGARGANEIVEQRLQRRVHDLHLCRGQLQPVSSLARLDQVGGHGSGY